MLRIFMLHFISKMNENDFFQMFDYGPAGNLKKYHQVIISIAPVKYDLSMLKIQMFKYKSRGLHRD